MMCFTLRQYEGWHPMELLTHIESYKFNEKQINATKPLLNSKNKYTKFDEKVHYNAL